MPDSLSPMALFVRALGLTTLGIGCGAMLFPSEASLVGVVLLAFSQGKTVEGLLNRNRDEIWGEVISPARANLKLAGSLMIIFLGVFITYIFAVQFAAEDKVDTLFDKQLGDFAAGSVRDISFGTFAQLLRHNGVVFLGCFAFALIYRHAGMLLVLAWNASAWGAVFSYLALVAEVPDAFARSMYIMQTLCCILPHLILEAAAYVLVAMAGVFTSLGMTRHKIGSDPFMQVTRAVLNIFVFALCVLAAAAFVEAYGAPYLVESVFG